MAFALFALSGDAVAPDAAVAQQTQSASDILSVPVGNSLVLTHTAPLRKVSIGNPEIADAVVVSGNEVVVNGRQVGSTTLLMWGRDDSRALYSVRVVADVGFLQDEITRRFPDQDVAVTAMSGSVILSGNMSDPWAAEQVESLAATLGEDVNVVNQIGVPDPGQVLLKVRFAEVNRTALDELGAKFMRVDPLNPRGDDEGAVGGGGGAPFGGDFLGGDGPEQTFSDAVNLFLFHESSSVSAFIQALKTRGELRSLAEPNLLAIPGEEASFLAGGEFPFPVLQGGGASNAVTIEWREFGVRLGFTPTLTNSGAIRLEVAPEVSSLNFSNALEIGGFRIPSLLARKTSTVVELQSGQTFAIAGLMDNSMTETMSKVPIIGDIPILGALFRSKEMRQNRSELLVLVTPQVVRPEDRAPDLPTGEPGTWDWDEHMRPFPPAGEGQGGPRADASVYPPTEAGRRLAALDRELVPTEALAEAPRVPADVNTRPADTDVTDSWPLAPPARNGASGPEDHEGIGGK